MKRTCTIIILVLSILSAFAQNKNEETVSIDEVMNACISLRDAVETYDTTAIHQSADVLRALKTIEFIGLYCKDDTVASLNGHLVFDENFADSLAKDKNAYQHAEEILQESIEHRGQNPDGSIKTKTCFVKAGETTTHSFRAKGYQELAVVAEAGGLVTMKIHVTNNAGLDVRHDDTKDVVRGRPHRRTSFDLPSDRSNFVELKVINCCNKDISFVVISN